MDWSWTEGLDLEPGTWDLRPAARNMDLDLWTHLSRSALSFGPALSVSISRCDRVAT
ncbi:hypothetical protein M5D96_011074 [Drosophila gunungcola]|uniref:Uncharacterized protein n=1 Tax=Drosophila gunungcola TaxID=103775 RepID=A0A9Q0BLV4_9MUSC|nr:hypothetical protein M5D96_011074 [Drosophila gunungcola]